MFVNKWPSKGTVEEDLIGNLNLIKLNCDSRKLRSKLRSQFFEEIFPAKEENESASPIVRDVLLGKITELP